MNWKTAKKVAILLLGFTLAVTGCIIFADFMVAHDSNSSYNVDKDAKALCKELHAEFRKVGNERVCIRDGEVVWP